MKQVICIYCGVESIVDEDDILKNGAGGSETWACELSMAFANRGFHVIVFSGCERWYFGTNGVEYVPATLFERRCEYQRFDYFISSRRVDILSNKISCNNIYVMSHDISLWFCDDYDGLKLDLVKKIACLSNYHLWCTKSWYQNKLSDDRLFLTSNGVNMSLYNDVDLQKKENMMVWSSRKERGLHFFVTKVMPKILEKVPDFRLKVCLYSSDLDSDFLACNNIEFLGKVGKEKLASLQKKSKIWIYPNLGYYDSGEYKLFQETFCITAIENGAAKNAILCGNMGGLQTTLSGYSKLIGDKYYTGVPYGGIYGDDNLENYAKELADEAIKILTDNKYGEKIALESYDICKKYTWDYAVDSWLKEWKIKY